MEAGNGFLIKCSCGITAVRATRPAADAIAVEHRASHHHPDPADQVIL